MMQIAYGFGASMVKPWVASQRETAGQTLDLIKQVEELLSKVEQSPPKTMQNALTPLMKALVMEVLLPPPAPAKDAALSHRHHHHRHSPFYPSPRTARLHMQRRLSLHTAAAITISMPSTITKISRRSDSPGLLHPWRLRQNLRH